MLWFWIKTYKDSGAYIHSKQLYDSVLQQGIPMWDEKGKRIKFNDPERLKSGEQEELSKQGNYTTNIKKYENIKMEV